MQSNCPICGNEIIHCKNNGFCRYCKKPYKVVVNQKGKKKFYLLEEDNNLVRDFNTKR